MRNISIWLVVLLLIITTGCSSQTPALPTDTPTPFSDTPSPETPTTPPGNTPGDLTLTLWLPPFLAPSETESAGDLLYQRLQAFSQQRPDLEIQVRIKAERGPGGLLETIQAASSAAPETLPDVIALDPVGLNTAALKGLIQPLNGVMDQPDDQEWYPHAIQASQIDGEFFGAPFASDGLVLAYRSNSFNNPPLSWSELIEADRTFLFPAGDAEALFTLTQYQSLGGQLASEDGRPALDPTTLSMVLTFYASAREAGVFPADINSYQTPMDTWQALLNGRTQSALAPLNSFLTHDETQLISISPLPTRDGKGMGISQTWSWAMVTEDPVRQAAVGDLINWLSAPEFLGTWSERLGLLPPTRSALELWEDEANAPVATLLAVALRGRPSEEDLATFGRPISQAVESVLTESLTAESAALQANQQIQSP